MTIYNFFEKAEKLLFNIASILLILSIFYSKALINISSTIIIVLFFISGDYISKKNFLNKDAFVKLAGGIATIVFISAIVTFFKTGKYEVYETIFQVFLFSCAFSFYINKFYRVAQIFLNIFIIDVFISCIFLIFLLYTDSIYTVYNDINFPSGPQYLLAVSLFTLSFFLIYRLQYSKWLYRYVYTLLAIFFIFMELFVNKSRVGYLVEILAIFILFFYLSKIFFKKSIINILISLIMLFTFILAIYNVSNTFKHRVDDVFTSVDVYFDKDILIQEKLNTSGVRLVWADAVLNIFKSNPKIFILGCGTAGEMLRECTIHELEVAGYNKEAAQLRSFSNPHNQFFLFIFEAGILAAILFSYMLYYLYFIYPKKINYIPAKKGVKALVFVFFIGNLFNSWYGAVGDMGQIYLFVVLLYLFTGIGSLQNIKKGK